MVERIGNCTWIQLVTLLMYSMTNYWYWNKYKVFKYIVADDGADINLKTMYLVLLWFKSNWIICNKQVQWQLSIPKSDLITVVSIDVFRCFHCLQFYSFTPNAGTWIIKNLNYIKTRDRWTISPNIFRLCCVQLLKRIGLNIQYCIILSGVTLLWFHVNNLNAQSKE